MKKTTIISFSLFLVFISGYTFAGKFEPLKITHSAEKTPADSLHTLTIMDVTEIKYQAEACIKKLESILNSIAFNDNTPDELAGYIRNSYTSNQNSRVFLNRSVIIESDIDPKYVLGSNEELPAEKYLEELSLKYQKASDFNITFSNITTSDVKKSDHIYIRIKYDETFGGKFKATGAGYPIRQREATIRIEKVGEKKWTAFIESIAYFNPDLLIDDKEYNIIITTPNSAVTTSDLEIQKAIIAKRKEVEEIEKQTAAQILEFVQSGDRERNNRQYQEALASYTKAMELAKVDPKIFKKIRDTKRLIEVDNHIDSVIKSHKDNFINMVLVKGGSFNMGSTDAAEVASPVHKVQLKSFYIGKYEVSQEEWMVIMGKDAVMFTENYNAPVTNVSWEEVQTFINKLNQQTGKKYRLPTEAEWEFAARGGNQSKGYIYSGSNDLGQVGWFINKWSLEPEPKGLKQPNELGIYDMSGNAWEWCQDWYNVNYYANSPVDNPVCLTPETKRVVRGGSCNNLANVCKTSRRDSRLPNYRYPTVGFRLVLEQ